MENRQTIAIDSYKTAILRKLEEFIERAGSEEAAEELRAIRDQARRRDQEEADGEEGESQRQANRASTSS